MAKNFERRTVWKVEFCPADQYEGEASTYDDIHVAALNLKEATVRARKAMRTRMSIKSVTPICVVHLDGTEVG